MWNKLPHYPRKGWLYDMPDVEDNGTATFECDMCDQKNIRYIHNLVHPDGLTIKVGCVCAAHLVEDYKGVSPRDRQTRRETLPDRRLKQVKKWQVTDWKHSLKNTDDRQTVTAWSIRGGVTYTVFCHSTRTSQKDTAMGMSIDEFKRLYAEASIPV